MRKTPESSDKKPSLSQSREKMDILISIEALKKHFLNNAMALATLDAIARKVIQVQPEVQELVAKLLKSSLEAHVKNTSTITAVVMAMDPKSTIAQQKTYMPTTNIGAANNQDFKIAA